MRHQTAKFLATAGVGIAGLPLSIVPYNPAQARECLAAPTGVTPAGSHWRYRVDHASKRNCWYLRGTGAATPPSTEADAAADNPADDTTSAIESEPNTKPDAGKSDAGKPAAAAAALQPAIANARAEYPSARKPTTSSADAASSDKQLAQNWPLDQRWSNVAQFDAPPANASDQPAPLRDAAETEPQPAPSETASPPAPTPLTAAPASLTASTASASKGPTSTSTLLGALAAALAFSGLTVGVLIKLGGRRPAFRFGKRRRDIWGSAAKARDGSPDASQPWLEPMVEAPKPRVLDAEVNEFEAYAFEAYESNVIELRIAEAESYQFDAPEFDDDDFADDSLEDQASEQQHIERLESVVSQLETINFEIADLAIPDFEVQTFGDKAFEVEPLTVEAPDDEPRGVQPFEIQPFDVRTIDAEALHDDVLHDDVPPVRQTNVIEPPQWVRAARERQMAMQPVAPAPAPAVDDLDGRSEEIEALLLLAQKRPAAG